MILDRILATKVAEIAAAKVSRPLRVVQAEAESAPAPRGFAQALRAGAAVQVIAEVKKASPSKGIIRPDFDPIAIAQAYCDGGAAALSVLTDEPYFQGHLSYLKALRGAVALPLLRKDFIVDAYQIYEARAAGADAILLIVAAFLGESSGGRTPADLKRLAALAHAQGMDVLTEVHTEAELQVALASGASLVGVNNRNLKTFEVDLDVTLTLAPQVPSDRLLVSESGIWTNADIQRVGAVGAKAVLVGESLMRQTDITAALQSLRGLGKRADEE